jgi:hypothetical protein
MLPAAIPAKRVSRTTRFGSFFLGAVFAMALSSMVVPTRLARQSHSKNNQPYLALET